MAIDPAYRFCTFCFSCNRGHYPFYLDLALLAKYSLIQLQQICLYLNHLRLLYLNNRNQEEPWKFHHQMVTWRQCSCLLLQFSELLVKLVARKLIMILLNNFSYASSRKDILRNLLFCIIDESWTLDEKLYIAPRIVTPDHCIKDDILRLWISGHCIMCYSPSNVFLRYLIILNTILSKFNCFHGLWKNKIL